MNQFSDGVINFVDRSVMIGEGTTIWWFAVVLVNCVIGKNVSIGSHAEIGKGTVIGDNTRIGKGVFLPPNSRIGRNCFISPGVYFADDKRPKVGNVEYDAAPPIVDDFAVVGMRAVILPGIRLGVNSFVGAGSVVTKNVPDGGIIYGDAAKLREMEFKHLSREYGWMGGA